MAAKVGVADISVTPAERALPERFSFRLYWKGAGQSLPGTTIRAGWASWGVRADCTLIHNGNAIADAPQPSQRATFALPNDFSGGVGAASSAGSVGSLQTDSRWSSGYLHALLATDAGISRVSGPEGQACQDGGDLPWVSVAEPTSGQWSFGFDGASKDQGAILWLMEL